MRSIPIACFRALLCCLMISCLARPAAALDEVYHCGMALGYPPYQYLDEGGEPDGLDVEVARMVFERMGAKPAFEPGIWDNVVASLRLDRLDCVAGMEINDERRVFFDFTTPYYSRRVVLFVRAEDRSINGLKDLHLKAVAGDRHSFVERRLQEEGLLRTVRIVKTRTKDESMRMLLQGNVIAVIAPRAVGLSLARRYGMAVRVIDVGDPGSPVGFAVAKGNAELRDRMENALRELEQSGLLQPVLDKWLGSSW
ncbi:amino acid ABC transporter substrate-binding protein (PAAT family) [Pseudodesulfovibrio indicus]|uniref:Amino acid ABC transporter substrate-binding protein (PAAT family) n=3 Tax=Pseudodesulfovibrio indicus TaxID=1716143 RepID=A0AA94PUH9_9BACT|nr:amino acid ABC transporter substrate-binding protein (PAAT family) [Pseudodesulfovibrio indicus]